MDLLMEPRRPERHLRVYCAVRRGPARSDTYVSIADLLQIYCAVRRGPARSARRHACYEHAMSAVFEARVGEMDRDHTVRAGGRVRGPARECQCARVSRRWLAGVSGATSQHPVTPDSRKNKEALPVRDVLHAGVKRDPTKFSNSRNAGPHSTFLAAAPRSDA